MLLAENSVSKVTQENSMTRIFKMEYLLQRFYRRDTNVIPSTILKPEIAIYESENRPSLEN